jgi:hypothetical protein
VQRVLALILATVSAGCMVVAIGGMVTGRFAGLSGTLLRATAVLCFAGAVALGTVSC